MTAQPGAGCVTVVVATRNRWPDLRESLPRHEAPVVLVDNGSTDGTPERVGERFPHVRVIRLPENRGAVARNVGVDAADTAYVAFADDDSWWAPGALTRAVSLFDAHPRLAVLAGRVLVGPDQRPDPVCALMAASPLGTDPDLPGPSVLGFLACGAVVRRAAYRQAGGFDDVVFFMGEEERLALDLAALGWGLAYVPDLVAHHHPSPSRNEREREVRVARNRLLTAVLRRPLPVVAATLAATARSGDVGRAGVLAALPRLVPALRARRVVPPHVEAARRLLG
ncbi:MAG TPA: glycosyltransferase [Intrasporangium sp.]|uniref:glycosyltransferase family 2 protein n=1 Tax=Intrasporangium sp. TaxID=1925024 RepID=UPI002D7A1E44|nr:glycosyltransferase [Intrasporangium sp.]HET7399678.1 glycosyltransferase [Intrasporangium sp.]